MGERTRFRLPPILTALALQFAALIIAGLLLRLAALPFSLLNTAIATGATAALLSLILNMARWWLIIQLLFAPTLVFMLELALPPAVYLGAFIFLALVYWSTYQSQIPLYLSSRRVWRTLEEILPPAQEVRRFTFIDIGSGTAGVIAHLARRRPDGEFVGIENAPLPYLIGWLRVKLQKLANCKTVMGSFWEFDLANFDVVYAYLSPVPMSRLWEKAIAEMKPGSLLISNTFTIPDHPPDYSITLQDWHHSTLHIWRLQKKSL